MKKLFFIFLLQITILLLVACSGAGGLALFRYKSEGNIYDYSSIGESEPYTMTQNEPLSILQGSTERQWFNTKFNEFKNVSSFPFDQHFLAGLCSTNDRYLFIITAYKYEDWTNPPSMYGTYLKSQSIFDYVGNPDHLAINIHKEGHAVVLEDLMYLIEYCNEQFYGIAPTHDLSKLTTSLYEKAANKDGALDELLLD